MLKFSRQLFLIGPMIFLAFCLAAKAEVISQDDLKFPVDQETLLQGNVQIALTLKGSESFFSEEPQFQEFDFFDMQKIRNDKVLAAKYAFVVERGIEGFSKERIFDAKGFEKISKNVTVRDTFLKEKTKISFGISKRIKFYKMTSNVDYYHFNVKDSDAATPEQEKMVNTIIHASPDGIVADLITVHRTYDFSAFFNLATNICLYKGIEGNKTLISCYIMSSMDSGTVNTLGFFVNFKNSLKEEILYTINKIKDIEE